MFFLGGKITSIAGHMHEHRPVRSGRLGMRCCAVGRPVSKSCPRATLCGPTKPRRPANLLLNVVGCAHLSPQTPHELVDEGTDGAAGVRYRRSQDTGRSATTEWGSV